MIKSKLGHYISEVEIEAILPHVFIKELEPGRLLFIEESIDENNYFLIEGLMKRYFETGKKRNITNFIKPGNLISNLSSEISDGKAWETLEAVTKVKLLYITKQSLFSICKSNYKLGLLYLDFIMKIRKNQTNKLRQIINKKSNEKVENFMVAYKPFADYVPQNEIASFLNVSPETLSRTKRAMITKSS
ncbi:Crp/Fnr family transcriptional regulator [Ferruginibacter lapsinanis]|uniref:Crp/Fnr family transcriptional regulator n=1 Tax=Ferruginibacter lapsinanis TaxID=563172 RepID=UPI001E33BD6E|nr:Crp/Fnr family transcriptional regulator [Ferruginibacter lapsinanis]UEG48657.1 Crp/Fnr family transcriptional regulator [Ferruginibacter lapsinanis]